MKQLLIAIDQLLNAIFMGWADETLSSRAYRTNPRLARAIDALFFWQDDHCRASYLAEIERQQLPPEFRP